MADTTELDNQTAQMEQALPGAPTDNMAHGTVTFEDDNTPDPVSIPERLLQGVGNFVYGAGMGLADPIYGAEQLGAHGLANLGLISPQSAQGIDQTVQGINQTYENSTPNSFMAGLGRFSGNALPYVLTSMEGAPDPAFVGPPLPPSSPLASAMKAVGSGAMSGMVQPVYGDNYWPEKATQIGIGAGLGAVPMIWNGLAQAGKYLGGAIVPSGLSNALQAYMNPEQTALSAYRTILQGANNPDIAQSAQSGINQQLADALTSASVPYVPGSFPTTEQIAGGSVPVMAAKALMQQTGAKGDYSERLAQNNAARLAAIGNVAQDEAALKAAVQNRSQQMTPAYEALENSGPIDATPVMNHIAQLRGSTFAADPVISKALNGLESQIQDNAIPIPGVPQTMVNPGMLDAISRNLRSIIGQHASGQPVTTPQVAALAPLKSTIQKTIGSQVEFYPQIQQQYAQLSEPINDMVAGQEVMKALGNAQPDVLGNPSPTRLATIRALQNAMEGGEYGVSANAANVFSNVIRDLNREAMTNSVRTAGSDTASNLASQNWLLQNIMGGSQGASPVLQGMAAMAGAHHPLMGALGAVNAVNKLMDYSSGRASNALAGLMLNPMEAAQKLSKPVGQSYNKLRSASAATIMPALMQQTRGDQ